MGSFVFQPEGITHKGRIRHELGQGQLQSGPSSNKGTHEASLGAGLLENMASRPWMRSGLETNSPGPPCSIPGQSTGWSPPPSLRDSGEEATDANSKDSCSKSISSVDKGWQKYIHLLASLAKNLPSVRRVAQGNPHPLRNEEQYQCLPVRKVKRKTRRRGEDGGFAGKGEEKEEEERARMKGKYLPVGPGRAGSGGNAQAKSKEQTQPNQSYVLFGRTKVQASELKKRCVGIKRARAHGEGA